MLAVSDRFSLIESVPKDLNRDVEGGAGGNHEIASQSLIKIEMVKWHQSKLCSAPHTLLCIIQVWLTLGTS